jgi:hypothetical protein
MQIKLDFSLLLLDCRYFLPVGSGHEFVILSQQVSTCYRVSTCRHKAIFILFLVVIGLVISQFSEPYLPKQPKPNQTEINRIISLEL